MPAMRSGIQSMIETLMRLSRFTVTTLLALSVPFSAALSVSAQTAPTQEPQAQTVAPSTPAQRGRALFDLGVAALGEARFADAAVAFEQSYQASAVPVVLFNMAFAYRGLGRNLDAIAAIERFVAQPGPTPPDRVAAGVEELARLRATIVRLTLGVTPAQAVVAIDGQTPRRDGVAYLADPGRRVLTVSLDGYHPQRVEREFAPGEAQSIPFRLSEITDEGRLVIEPSVTDANVTIEVDGAISAGARYDQRLTAGRHRIVVNAPGYLTFSSDVSLGGTGIVRVNPVLQRPRASQLFWVVPLIIVVGGSAITATSIAVEYQVRRPQTPIPSNCINCFDL